MSEWWTYELSDFLMFSSATWYRLLELHNAAWGPAHALAALACAGVLGAAFSKAQWAARAALLLVGLAWLFAGWTFHWERYSAINWGAAYFAGAFLLEGGLLVALGLAAGGLRLAASDWPDRFGPALLLAALLYPLLSVTLGRPFSQSEWFALMPDPTALATLGLLPCLHGEANPGRSRLLPLLAWPLPLLWCAVTGATLWTLKAPEWFVLPLAAAATVGLLASRARRQ